MLTNCVTPSTARLLASLADVGFGFAHPARPQATHQHSVPSCSVGLVPLVTVASRVVHGVAGHLSRGSVLPVSPRCTACAAISSGAVGCPVPPMCASARIRTAICG